MTPAKATEPKKTMTQPASVNVSIRDLAIVAVTLIGWVANYAALSSRVAAQEQAIAQIQARYEREVVPRSEHIEMNKRLEERLGAIETELQNITRQIVNQNQGRR